MNIVLFEPEIPQNTGNIIRTCVCTGTTLHMIRPFGFSMDEKQIKRAGMDYISHADIIYYDCFEDYFAKYDKNDMFFFTTKSQKSYSDVKYTEISHLIFGPESRGLPEHIRTINPDNDVRIPMKANEYVRSLNLSNSVSIGLFEAMRQINFANLI